jgi:hypothetical protein
LVAFFAVTFFLTGAAYGAGSRSIQSHRDLVRMMRDGIAQLAPYIVLAFFAASDGIVLENLGVRFMKDIQVPEVRRDAACARAKILTHARSRPGARLLRLPDCY